MSPKKLYTTPNLQHGVQHYTPRSGTIKTKICPLLQNKDLMSFNQLSICWQSFDKNLSTLSRRPMTFSFWWTSRFDVLRCTPNDTSTSHVEAHTRIAADCRRLSVTFLVLWANRYLEPSRYVAPVSDTKIHPNKAYSFLVSSLANPTLKRSQHIHDFTFA